jgi:predicted nucleotidyltransferase
MNNTLTSTNAQRVLDFLIQNPGRQLLANEIERATKVSRAGVNFSLRKLAKEKLVIREKKAKIYLYSVDHTDPVIKQLKVLKTVSLLKPVLAKVKNFSQKMILFGSCARGENIPNSDIDLFILTNSQEEVRELIKKHSLNRKFQLVIRTPLKFAEMKNKEPVFFEEVSRGITLWEAKE